MRKDRTAIIACVALVVSLGVANAQQCASLGCTAQKVHSDECQCNPHCVAQNDCCDDYVSACAEAMAEIEKGPRETAEAKEPKATKDLKEARPADKEETKHQHTANVESEAKEEHAAKPSHHNATKTTADLPEASEPGIRVPKEPTPLVGKVSGEESKHPRASIGSVVGRHELRSMLDRAA